MSKTSLIALGAALLAAGLALVVAAAALAFQNGIIADATSGVGVTTPVEYAMWLVGLVLAATGGVMLPLAARRHRV